MIFSSMIFVWIYLPIVLVGNFIIQKVAGNAASNGFLLVASLLFYAWGEPVYIILLMFSIVLNWAGGLVLSCEFKRRRIFWGGLIFVNLALLMYFKYAAMLISSFNQLFKTSYEIPHIALPAGISFFTFQALSYVIDVYKAQCPAQKSICKLALYLSFFPQLIAGPIVKYKDMEEQLCKREWKCGQLAEGIRRFVYGFSKKVLISNTLAFSVDRIYSLQIVEVTGVMAWAAALMYTLQIYYDFSGYSDMAIGLGKMFGFELRENFAHPYTARSIQEFWRKWHISLSEWFREYLYIPLGGSRGGMISTYRNLLIVFLLTGVWHGASWNFVLWGFYHACFLILERSLLKETLQKNRIFSSLYTLTVINFGWVLFRITDIGNAVEYVKRMCFPWNYVKSNYMVLEFVDWYTIFIFACGILGCGFIHKVIPKKVKTWWKNSYIEILCAITLLVLAFASLAGNTYNPFIYYRF